MLAIDIGRSRAAPTATASEKVHNHKLKKWGEIDKLDGVANNCDCCLNLNNVVQFIESYSRIALMSEIIAAVFMDLKLQLQQLGTHLIL